VDIHLSPNDGVSIYLQIVNQVKYLVAAGRLLPGDELPAIRALAQRLRINPNTVAHAYQKLEEDGVVIKRGTTGTYVSDGGSPLALKHRLKILKDRADAFLAEARSLNIGFEEVLEILRQRNRELHPRSGEEGSND